MTIDQVLTEINTRARAFRDQQVVSLREGLADQAHDDKLRAMVLEQLLADLTVEHFCGPQS